jgi:uncharacterized OB-fold protein
VQTCAACGASQFYPRWLCVICGSADVALVPVAGTATVYSSTVVNKSPNPELFVAPYVVALVRLDEGPTLLTNVVGQGALDVSCDDRVTLTWEPLPDGRQLPLFTPDSPRSTAD